MTPTESNTSEHSDSGSDSHLSKKSLKKKRNHENKRLRRLGLLTDDGKPTEKALAEGLLNKNGRPTEKARAEGLLSNSHSPVHQPQVNDESPAVDGEPARGASAASSAMSSKTEPAPATAADAAAVVATAANTAADDEASSAASTDAASSGEQSDAQGDAQGDTQGGAQQAQGDAPQQTTKRKKKNKKKKKKSNAAKAGDGTDAAAQDEEAQADEAHTSALPNGGRSSPASRTEAGPPPPQEAKAPVPPPVSADDASLATVRSDHYARGTSVTYTLYRKHEDREKVQHRVGADWAAVRGPGWAWGVRFPAGCSARGASVRLDVRFMKIEMKLQLPSDAAGWSSPGKLLAPEEAAPLFDGDAAPPEPNPPASHVTEGERAKSTASTGAEVETAAETTATAAETTATGAETNATEAAEAANQGQAPVSDDAPKASHPEPATQAAPEKKGPSGADANVKVNEISSPAPSLTATLSQGGGRRGLSNLGNTCFMSRWGLLMLTRLSLVALLCFAAPFVPLTHTSNPTPSPPRPALAPGQRDSVPVA